MNEQIKELAHQADFIGKKHNGAEWRWGHIEKELAEKLEKFAELIVRECIGLIDTNQMITAAQTYDEVFVAKYDTRELCVNQIREHFGVEE